jgi:hypothetical protein
MINVYFIRMKVREMDISLKRLSDMTGVGYATIHAVMQEERQLSDLKARNYIAIVEALFTPYELLILEKARFKGMGKGLKGIEKEYHKLVLRAFKEKDCKINLSGGVTSDENGVLRLPPSHIILRVKGTPLNEEIRIFDKDLYLEFSQHQKRRKEDAILEHLESKAK